MAERVEFAKNASKFCPGCLVGIPTLGLVDAQFMLSIANTHTPLNWRTMTYVIKGKPVDVARNEIVEVALRDGFEWILFRDDDVLAPADALNKLYSLHTPIAAGVVYGKQWPTRPMIFKWDDIGSYEDWKLGDVFEADWTGMGCTLIHRSVFEAIEPPWFKTDPGSTVVEDGKIVGTQSHTEDAYFFRKAEKAGFKPVVDTNVQCNHLDVTRDESYYFDPALNAPVKVGGHPGQVWVYPTVARRKEGDIRMYPKDKPDIVRFNLGCSNVVRAGYINVDKVAGTGVDEVGDCKSLRWLTRKYGLADEVYASHLLEHFRPEEVPGVLRDWVHTLKPGGKLHVFVPDFEWAIQQFLDRPDDDREKYQYLLYMIFGQAGEGMEHKTGITAKMLMSVMPTLPVCGIEVTVHEDGSEIEGFFGRRRAGQEIELIALRNGDSVAGHGMFTSDPGGREPIADAKNQMEVRLEAGQSECGEPTRVLPGDSAEIGEVAGAEADT